MSQTTVLLRSQTLNWLESSSLDCKSSTSVVVWVMHRWTDQVFFKEKHHMWLKNVYYTSIIGKVSQEAKLNE